MMSRDFDGIALSGGQWQRVAIARSVFKPHDYLILDEPTSAIDPLEESSIYNQFANYVKNKTAILVTHRLGAVKIAHRIAVMAQGKVVEIVTHEALLKQGGEYSRMWEAQAEGYVTGL